MGRYFPYRIHPLSVAELIGRPYQAAQLQLPQKINDELWQNLYQFGGFPEPLHQQNTRFLKRWQRLRIEQMLQEDIRDLTAISNLAQMEVLIQLLQSQVAGQVSYSGLARKVQVTDKTIKSWLATLEALYYSFSIRPWHKNISRAVIKEPKIYLWDWSGIQDKGARVENLIASHLLKAVHYWTDIGLGDYALYYVRDKEKREVDFLITYEGKPWLLAEVKSSDNRSLSKSLLYFQNQVQAEHVFQIVFDLPYVDRDCFAIKKPIIVPARTILSQLI